MKPIKITLNEKQGEIVESFKKSLKKRGLRKVDLSLVFQRALEAQGEGFLSQILEEMTPLEYKIKRLSQNKSHHEEIKEFISKFDQKALRDE